MSQATLSHLEAAARRPAIVAAADDDEVMLALIRQRIAITGLDLRGLDVVTEAATGAYRCTAVIAALAGAPSVVALARDTARHGSAAEAGAATLRLASRAGVADRIQVVKTLERDMLSRCWILTNCGHLRPITSAMIAQLPLGAVIALMFEAWEFRPADLDLAACAAAGVRVAAVNERHPTTGVFPFLGPLGVRLLEESGTRVDGSRIALLCDNPFAPFVEAGLMAAGAKVSVFADTAELGDGDWQAVVVALTPAAAPSLQHAEFLHLARHAPRAVVAQFWGDVDREAGRHFGFCLWPPAAPGRGHMGILLNALGAEPIVRLQTGGMRAAEFILRGGKSSTGGIAQLVE